MEKQRNLFWWSSVWNNKTLNEKTRWETSAAKCKEKMESPYSESNLWPVKVRIVSSEWQQLPRAFSWPTTWSFPIKDARNILHAKQVFYHQDTASPLRKLNPRICLFNLFPSQAFIISLCFLHLKKDRPTVIIPKERLTLLLWAKCPTPVINICSPSIFIDLWKIYNIEHTLKSITYNC